VFDGVRSDKSDAKIEEVTRRLNDRLDQELEVADPSFLYQHRDMRAPVKLWHETDPWSAKARNTQINYQDKVSPLLM
ncbi:MAG: hypothetical protein AAF642_14035, partial [Pseudomonadota bacterium]